MKYLALACTILLLTRTGGAQTVAAELVTEGLDTPIYVCAPEGDTARIFVIEQRVGKIRIVDLASGVILYQPFLDIGNLITSLPHQGLLGLAFHPDYAANGRFFVDYTDLAGDIRVVEYRVSSNPNRADPNPVQTITGVAQPTDSHNGGCLQFGSDGMLYVTVGDGGPEEDPSDRAQNLDTNLGKLLRFDVDLPTPFIPPSNPHVGVPGNDEIWASGLRSPWRFSFDRLTGDLYLSDVGELLWEEINFQPASSAGGENYGWRCREGAHPFNVAGCTLPTVMTDPLHEYAHNGNPSCVIGGHVYRGAAIPALQGTYFFGDFRHDTISSFRKVGDRVTELVDRTAELAASGLVIDQLVSFGEDGVGELYVVGRLGQIHRLIEGCNGEAQTYCVASPNGAGAGAVLSTSGSLEMTNNDFTLAVAGARPNNFGLFFYGLGSAQVPRGNGVLCIDSAGGLWRLLPLVPLDAQGVGSYAVDFQVPPMNAGPGQVHPGTTHYFQFWYRDPGSHGPADYNYSNGVMATFCM